MLTLVHWNPSSNRCHTHADPAALPEFAADVTGEHVWWVDLSNPTPEEEALVFERFLPVHPLTLEDVTKARREPDQGAHFPKVEEFPDYLFVVVNPLPPGLVERAKGKKPVADDPPQLPLESASGRLRRKSRPQLSAVITERVLITHHYTPLPCVTEVRATVDRHGDCARRGPDYLFHLVLDAMVDEYAPVVDRVAARLDRLETRLFTDPSRTVLTQMLRLKRLVSGLRKTLIMEREVLARLMRGEFALVAPREIAYYRNVYDHLARYSELIEGAREMVSDLMQTHLSAMSNRLNEVMKALAMVSTIGAIGTLIAGIYGMNFENMPELKWRYGYPFALALIFVCTAGATWVFRRKGWI